MATTCRGLIRAIEVYLVVAKVVSNVCRVCKHRHVAVIVVAEAHGTSIRSIDPGHSSHRIVGVCGRVVFRIGNRFDVSLRVVGKSGDPAAGCNLRKSSPGVVTVSGIKQARNGEPGGKQILRIIISGNCSSNWRSGSFSRLWDAVLEGCCLAVYRNRLGAHLGHIISIIVPVGFGANRDLLQPRRCALRHLPHVLVFVLRIQIVRIMKLHAARQALGHTPSVRRLGKHCLCSRGSSNGR